MSAAAKDESGTKAGAGAFRTPWGDDIAFNLKCIYGTIGAALLYWFLPAKNKWVLLGILFAVYLCIAWYDHWYGCSTNPLRPTFLYSFYGWAKPEPYRRAYRNWQPDTKQLVLAVDAGIAMLLLLILPAFLRWKPHSTCSPPH